MSSSPKPSENHVSNSSTDSENEELVPLGGKNGRFKNKMNDSDDGKVVDIVTADGQHLSPQSGANGLNVVSADGLQHRHGGGAGDDSTRFAPKPEVTSGKLGASFNFINSIIGAGIIGLPLALKHCGLWFGVLLMASVAGMTHYTVMLLISNGHRTGKSNYEELAQHAMGATGFYLVSIFMFLFAYGALLAYVIVLGDTMPAVLRDLFGDDVFLGTRTASILFFSLLLMLPLSSLRDMASLSKSSAVSLLSVIIIVVLVAVRAKPAHDDMTDTPSDDAYSFAHGTFFAGIGAMSFAFVCHHNSFIVFNSLDEATVPRFASVSRWSVSLSFCASCFLGVVGYLTFLQFTQGDVLRNFAEDDTTITVARFLLAMTMVLTFPMEMFVARHCFYKVFFTGPDVATPRAGITDLAMQDSMSGSDASRAASQSITSSQAAVEAALQREKPASTAQHVGITLLLFVSAMSIGLVISDLGVVLELVGAVAGSTLGYVLPVVVHFKVTPGGITGLYSDARTLRPAAIVAFVLPLFVGVFGCVCAVAGSVYVFVDP